MPLSDGLDVVDNGRVISFVGNVHVVINPEEDAKAPALRVLTSDATPADARP